MHPCDRLPESGCELLELKLAHPAAVLGTAGILAMFRELRIVARWTSSPVRWQIEARYPHAKRGSQPVIARAGVATAQAVDQPGCLRSLNTGTSRRSRYRGNCGLAGSHRPRAAFRSSPRARPVAAALRPSRACSARVAAVRDADRDAHAFARTPIACMPSAPALLIQSPAPVCMSASRCGACPTQGQMPRHRVEQRGEFLGVSCAASRA